jgi:hypothetical protein
MSDIGIDFPIWLIAALALAYALPMTTIILAALVFASLWRRRTGLARIGRSVALDLAIVVMSVLWLAGLCGWVWFGIDWLGG